MCLSSSTGTRLRWRSLATSSPFRKNLTITFMIPFMAGPYEQTTCLKYYSGRQVSWARVPEIGRQNNRALFRPKSKKMTGNSMITFVSNDEILQEDATFNFRENMWHSVNNPVKTEGSPASFPPWRNWTHLRSTGLQHRRLRSQRGQAWARWRDSWQTRPSNGEAVETTTHGSRSHQIEQNQGYLWKAGSSQHDFHFERTEKQ